MTDLHFSTPASVAGWTAIDDRVMGGVSSSRLVFHPEGHAVFEGTVSRANGGGFASVRHNTLRLGAGDTVAYRLRVRGDGKRYKLNLRMDGAFDGVSHQAAFQPPADQWTEVDLPLQAFSATHRGRAVPGAPALRPDRVRQVGWMVADGQTGPFVLAIRSVVCVNLP